MNENDICTEAQMLVRKSAAEAFNAFVDPKVTTNFWFTKSSGKLEEHKSVTWQWEMYNVSAAVQVIHVRPNKSIVFEWNSPPRTVSISFQSLDENSTYIIIKETGYAETGAELLRAVKDSTAGFTTVLDGMKAFLEYNIRLNLIGDKFPHELS